MLAQYQADLFVVVVYGEFLKQHLLDMPKLGCINLHMTLLPRYRGAAPIQRSIIDGQKETGVGLSIWQKRWTAGDIIRQSGVPIDLTPLSGN